MTIENPALYLQSEAHPAENFRRWTHALMNETGGVIGEGSLAVSEKSGTPNMSVDVAGGYAIIKGDEGTYQGSYFVENRGTTNVSIAAADGSNDRYDVVYAYVADSDYSGATDAWDIAVETGTPAASPAIPTVSDSNALHLAVVHVQAAVSSITDSDITDVRTSQDTQNGGSTVANYGRATAHGGVIACQSSYRPQSPDTGEVIYETDTDDVLAYDGSAWVTLLKGETVSGRDSDGSTATTTSFVQYGQIALSIPTHWNTYDLELVYNGFIKDFGSGADGFVTTRFTESSSMITNTYEREHFMKNGSTGDPGGTVTHIEFLKGESTTGTRTIDLEMKGDTTTWATDGKGVFWLRATRLT